MANLTNLLALPEARTPYSAGEGNVNFISVKFDVGTDNLGAADIWRVITLPADASILYAAIDTDELDDDGTPELALDLGIIGGDTDALIDGAGTDAFTAATDVSLGPQAADYTIGVTVQAAAESAVAGTARVDLAYVRTATEATSIAE